MSKRADRLSHPPEIHSLINYYVSYPRTWSHRQDTLLSCALPNIDLSEYKQGRPSEVTSCKQKAFQLRACHWYILEICSMESPSFFRSCFFCPRSQQRIKYTQKSGMCCTHEFVSTLNHKEYSGSTSPALKCLY